MTTQSGTDLTPAMMAEALLVRNESCSNASPETPELPVLPVLGYWSQDVDPNHHLGPEVDTVLLRSLYENSARFIGHLGTSYCRVCGRGDLGSSDLTNGWALYPSGLAHYVAEHRLVLPQTVRTLLLAPARPLPQAPFSSWRLSEPACEAVDHTGTCLGQHFSLELWKSAMTAPA